MSFFSLKKKHPSAPQLTAVTVAQTPSQAQLAAKDPDDATTPQPRQQNRAPFPKTPPHSSPPQQTQPQQPQQQHQQRPWSTHRLLLTPYVTMPPTSHSPLPLPHYRYALPATATANGELYLFGGLVREAARNDLYLFSITDFSATVVQTTGELPSPRVGHASAIVSSVLIVWGGDTQADTTSDPTEKQDNSLFLLNLLSKEWTKLTMYGPSPSGRYGHAVTMVGSKFFVFGGEVDGEFPNDLWSFDLNTLRTQPQWELCQPTTTDRPTQRTGHICVTYGDRIIVFGGTDGQHHYNDTWAYDVNTYRWTEFQCIGFIPSPREGHAAAVVDDFIYIFGGRGVDGKDLGDLAAFKLSNQRWYMFQNMGAAPSARSGHAMASMGSRIFVLGGESFTPTTGDDHGIIHVLDTRRIKYPHSNKVVPPNPNGSASNVPRKLSTTPSPPGGQPAPPLTPDGTSAMSPAGPQSDAENLRRAMTLPENRPGTRTPNRTTSSVPTQSLVSMSNPGTNTKVKPPVCSPRDEKEALGTDDGDAADTGVTPESTNNISVATERLPTLKNPQIQAEHARSPTYGVANRVMSPLGGSIDGLGQQGQTVIMSTVPMSMNVNLSARSSSPTDDSSNPLEAFYQSSPSVTSLTNNYVHSDSHSQQRFCSTGNVTADLIRDYKAKEMEVAMLRKREAWMKAALLKASRAGFVQVDEELFEAEDPKLRTSTTDEQVEIADMILGLKRFKTQMQTTLLNQAMEVLSVAFPGDGEYIVSGDDSGKIRRWQVEDGNEVGIPMDAGNAVWSLAASQDGRWIVSGLWGGDVMVWDADSREKVKVIDGHQDAVNAVDISPDATKIASGSRDGTVLVWSLSTGEPLLGPSKQDSVASVKFSPNGHLIAIAALYTDSVRIYNSQDGHLQVEFPIQVRSYRNQSLVWGSDRQLFALSRDGDIHDLDVYTEKELSKWSIHSNDEATCISQLASNGAFIAASANSSVSFWDTTTHKQIGSVIHHPASVYNMAISANHDFVTVAGSKIVLRNLLDIIPSSYFDDTFKIQPRLVEAYLKETIESLRAQNEHSHQEIANLQKIVQELRTELTDSQDKADGIVRQLRTERCDSQQKVDHLTELLYAYRQKHHCETLYAENNVIAAAQSLLEIVRNASDDLKADRLIVDWLSGFTNKCISELVKIGDKVSKFGNDVDALAAYSTALSLGPSTPNPLLIKWVSIVLCRGSTNEVLNIASKFKVPRFLIYRAICDILEGNGRITEAIGFFRQMQRELPVDTNIQDEQRQWELSFQRQCIHRLEQLADAAMGSQNYDGVVEHLTTILSLDAADRVDTLIRRSKVRAMMNAWEDMLNDADKVLKLDPSSYRGYEQRHAALHGARRYAEAVEAFDRMLLELDRSTNQHLRELRSLYVDSRPEIRCIIDQTVSHMPRVLIDTTTGQLQNKRQVAKAFETLQIFEELVSSMTRKLDHARTQREVKEFYQYVMFSHKWEDGEPLLQNVEHAFSAYKLKASAGNTKLQMFCSHVRSLGIRWAWSDTCCIDKDNNVVLQESLVAMFSWYRGSSLTLVYLHDVSSRSSNPGLKESVWNTRAWTYQEYLAAERVQFYTEDWKPYLGLTLSNHKESPDIISEMEQVSHVSPEKLAVLQPGLDRVREKLYLASTRQTTLVEDIAYSLLGIFNVAIPVIYGEGNRSVGRLLEHILTGSGDVTILAWTGTANRYNTCLPMDLTVYKELVPPHIPPVMEMAVLDQMVLELCSSLTDLLPATRLYDRLNELPSPFLASSRLRLPGIVSLVTDVVHMSGPDPKTNLCVYHGTTAMFGDTEIKTTNKLTMMDDLYLVHPWIRPLLDQDFSRGSTRVDKATRALRLIARLRQPFGALLFEQLSRVEYKRVAADSLIMVQVCKDVSLEDLIDNVLTIDVQ